MCMVRTWQDVPQLQAQLRPARQRQPAGARARSPHTGARARSPFTHRVARQGRLARQALQLEAAAPEAVTRVSQLSVT